MTTYPKKINNQQTGFSLVEAVLYVGIIGMVIGAFISFVLMMSQLRNKFHVIEEIQANKRGLTEILDYYLHNAKIVDNPIKHAASSQLDFVASDGKPYSILLAANRLVLRDSLNNDTFMTTGDVKISDLQIFNLAADGAPDTLRLVGKIEGAALSSVDYEYQDNIQYNVNLSR